MNQRETTMPEHLSPATRARVDRLLAAVLDTFQDLSGLSLTEADPSTTFLEMGFDSLFITQATQALQNRFGLRITFRQLIEQHPTPGALAAHLDAQLPADAFPAEPSAAPVPATSTALAAPPNAPALPGSIDAIIREQLQVMSQLMAKQLEAVRGTGNGAAPLPAPEPKRATEAAKPSAAQEFKPFGPYKPVQRGPVGGLTERQARHLDALIRRYTAKTARSKEATQRRRQILADPRVVAGFRAQWKEMVYPLVTVRSQGSRLWDADGNEYIDILNGFGPIMLGHAPAFVTEAVAAQMREGFEIGPQTLLAGEVAELVCELTGNERVSFCNTGSEAVMAAIRIARTVTGRAKVVFFAGSYHGTFDEVLVKGVRKGGEQHALPIAPGIPVDKAANVVVLEYGSPESLEYIRRHANELAAVLVEPVQSRHPDLQPVEFLRRVRAITEESGAALIFDEVVTGFRVHPGGVQALFGIRADLATYGKVAGGGLPIGILAGRAKFMDALDGGMWRYGDDSFPEVGVTFFAGTFVRHPLALAAASAVLKHLKKAGPELQRSLAEKTAALIQDLNADFAGRGAPLRIGHFASWFYFNFPPDQPYGSLLYYHLREKGIHIQEGFPCFLTTAHTDADLAAVARAFKESVAELQEGGFLTGPARRDDSPVAVPAPAPARDAGLPTEVPMTESQVEVWLSAQMGDDASCSFNESFTLELRGTLNVPALRKAVERLVGRHDALRSTFDPGRNCTRVHDTVPVEMPLVRLAPGEADTGLERLIREEATTPFDLTAGPLVRVRLVEFGPDRHTLLFTTHHIVCDGWSTNVLLGELAELYRAECAGTAVTLPPASPFRGYALAEARRCQTADHASVESWWAAKFAVPPGPLELPTDRPRGAAKSFRGDTARRAIGAEPFRRIKLFGARQGCTLFATLLTGFKTLLHRLTGQHDIAVGIPAAGQSLIGDESLVGHCVNFLPVRSSFEGDPKAAAMLARVRASILDAYDHQNYTYGSLVRKLALKRDPSRLPLVEVQFNLERVGTGLAFPGLTAKVDPCPKSFVNFDLFLNVIESDDGLVLDCDYNRDLFDPATVERWLGHLETLLVEMAGDSGRAVSEQPLLSDAERRRILVEWNDTKADYPSGKCAHELIGEQATLTPHATAAVCGDRHLTYAELDGSANRLAHYLRKRGAGAGDRVAVCVERSLEMLVGVLGVLKAGAAYVPLDPEFPRERVSSVIEDANPSLILTQQSVASRLGLTGPRVLHLESAWPEMSGESDAPPATAVKPADPAYVIYTSGSTGKPKGVQVPHRALVNLLGSMANRPGLTSRDALLAVTTLAFDIAALELYLPLCVGAKVVLATRDEAGDGNKLLALLKGSGATVMQATPATWRMLIEAGWGGWSDLKVLCGGEALPRDLADELLARSRSVWNMYGPTETTVWSATSLVEPGSGPVTVGPPIANTEFYVLDTNGQPLPIGVAGELLIGGDGVAIGYWNRPELTAEKFVSDPFRPGSGRRLYRTGDLVRHRPDGTLEFLGRLDNQVKIRGFRIETGDVEHALKSYPGMRDCVVVAREDTPGQKQLVGYVVVDVQVPTARELRSHLAEQLPSYMVPSAFVPMDALPLTPNGKVDRRALPVPADAGALAGRGNTPPRTPEERTLAGICATILKQTTVYVDDNLFDLGADSLLMFQIVSRARDAGLNLTPKQILTRQTIAAICEDLAGSEPVPATNGPALTAVNRDKYRLQRPNVRSANGTRR
jgi:amino acid adenylation domain-containing protein